MHLNIFSKLFESFVYLRKSTFVKNFLLVMSGTVIAQLISFSISPIISRLFSPYDFGLYGSFLSILMIIASCITLDYNQALILPAKNTDAINLFIISIFSSIIIIFLCLIIHVSYPTLLQHSLKTSNNTLIVILFISMPVYAFFITFQAWCIRIKAFKRTSTSQIIRSISANSVQVGLGYFKFGVNGLAFGYVFADMCSTINLLKTVYPEIKKYYKFISFRKIKFLAKEYRDFPIYSSSKNLINAISSGLPVLLLSYFHGYEIAGAYAFSYRILASPMEIILRPLRQVLFQKGSEILNQKGNLLSIYLKSTIALSTIAILPTSILYYYAPKLFSLIFGSQWLSSGQFAQIMILWLFMVFCNLPAVQFARLIRIQRFVFFFEIIQLIILSSSLIIGGLYFNPLNTIIIYSVSGILMNLLLILLVGIAVYEKRTQN